MEFSVTIQGQGLEQMARIARRLGELDRAGLMRRLGGKVLEQHIRRITSEKTDPAGKAWAKLLPSTVAQKGNSNILIRTGKMAGAFRMRSSALRAVVSNSAPYLKYHQTGTRTPMAQRRVMGLSAKNIAELQTILNSEISRLMG